MNWKKLLAAAAALTLITSCGAKDTSGSESAAETTAAQSETTEVAETTEAEDTTEAEETTEPAEEAVEYTGCSATARELISELASGNASPLHEALSSDFKDQLSENDIKMVWVQTQMSSGKFVEMLETTEEIDGTMSSTHTTLKFENEELVMDIEFAGEGVIIGLFIHEPDSDEPEEILPEETDDFAETAIKVGEYDLDGLLCMPKNAENPPLLVLVWGSGQCDMNELGVFSELSHELAERGVATLRFNKRFYQFPEMANEDVTVDDEYLDDVDSAIALAQTYADSGEVSGIYVLGHSLGGSLMPSIAERSSNVKAAISLAGTPRHLIDVWIEQINAQLELLSEGPLRDYMETLIDQAETLRDEGIIKETDNPSLYQVTSVFFGIPYYESLQAIEPAEIADTLTIPMLFIQGDADVQVYPDRDYPAWQEKLADNPNCTFKLYEGLGHFFNDKTGDFDETVIDDIADFIKNN